METASNMWLDFDQKSRVSLKIASKQETHAA